MTRGLRGGVRLLAAALLFGGAVSMAAPSDTLAQDPTEEDASVRIAHGSPDSPPVDVIVDGAAIAENVAFGTVSDYVPISAGTHQVQVVPTGSDAASAVIDEELELEEGDAYIFATSGLLNEIDAQLYEVDLSGDDMEADQARIRLIHLSPDAESVDVYVAGGDELIDDASFPDASDYATIDAGTYDLELRQHDSDTVSLSLPGVEFQAGRVYDILTLGQVSDNSLTALPLETRVSPACSDVLGVGTPADACIRVLHASPDGPAIDVYVNDTLLIENLAYASNTEYAALPGGEDRNIKIVPTGSPLDAAIYDDNTNLDAGQAYTIMALNNVDDLGIAVAEDNLDPLPVNQSRIAVINAAVNSPDVDVVVTDGPTLFEGVGFEEETDDSVVDSGAYDVQMKDGDTVVARVEELTLDPGMAYYLVAIGDAETNTVEVIVLSAQAAAIEGGAVSPAASPVTGTENTGLVEVSTPEVVSTPVP